MRYPPPNVFALFGKSAMLSYHLVNPALFWYHSVNSAVVYTQWQLLRFDVQCGGRKVKISEFIFAVIRLAPKFNKSFQVINI